MFPHLIHELHEQVVPLCKDVPWENNCACLRCQAIYKRSDNSFLYMYRNGTWMDGTKHDVCAIVILNAKQPDLLLDSPFEFIHKTYFPN